MIIQLLVPILFLQLSLAAPEALQCKLSRSKICQLDVLTWNVNRMPKLPDLSKKHTIIIRSGSIVDFSQNLSSQLGDVTKLQLGQLEIQSLYISPKWISLKAESNQIYDLTVEELPSEKLPDADESLVEESIMDEQLKSELPKKSEASSSEDGESTTDRSFESDGTNKSASDTLDLEASDDPRSSITVNELRFLNLVNNKLKSVSKLKHLFKLEELLLDGNQIEFIDMETFSGMNKLKILTLTKNMINKILTPNPINLPALEELSLSFNQLEILEIDNWEMLQLTQLDVSHNRLVKMNVPTLTKFVSLERMAIDNNLWHCDWLQPAVKNLPQNSVQLKESNETCKPEQYDMQSICCSYALSVDDDSVSILDKIQQIEKGNELLKKDLDNKVESFETEWVQRLNKTHKETTVKLELYEKRETGIQKDDDKQVATVVQEFEKLIEECRELLEEINSTNSETKKYTRKFTHLLFTTIAEKNKLLQEMANAAKLEEEMKKYEMSFNANH